MVLSLGLVRLLAIQPWDAELVPVAIAAMILAIAYNPHFALMVDLRALPADLPHPGHGDRPLPRAHGGDGGGRADARTRSAPGPS